MRPLKTILLALAGVVAFAPSSSEDPSFRHILVERDQPAKMRDGVTLYADVYRPDAGGRFPALLMRTPYNKAAAAQSARFAMTTAAVRRGYVVVIQDTRGQFTSEGTFDPYRQEINDGHDSIEWAARLPWVNGRVGTFGLSYPGAVQWMTAPTRPPSLVAMSPSMTFANANHFVYHGGIFEADFVEWLLGRQIRERRARRLPLASPEEIEAAWQRDGQAWMDHRPLRDLPVMNGFAYWKEWIDHPIESDYWKPYDIEAQHPNVGVPVLNLSGWNDDAYGQPGAIRNFLGMRARGATKAARDGQRLVMGPWAHGVPANTKAAGVDYGPNAAIDYVELQLRFFDHWLKGIDNGHAREAPVKYFVMGENRWHESQEWPPASARVTPWYLVSGGALTRSPAQQDGAASFSYDPARRGVVPSATASGPADWRGVVTSPGVLAFTSEPLAAPMEITGQVIAHLWITTHVAETDVTVRLLAVAPDGHTRALTNAYGALRASYRTTESVQPRRPLSAGEPTELTISVGYTSVLVPEGDRLQAIVTGSLRQGLETMTQPAVVRVLHGPLQASRITFPVVHRP